MKYDFDLIQHSSASGELINSIIKLKQQHWPYDKDSQYRWIRNNIKSDDYHLIIKTDDGLMAYMDIVNVKIRQRNNVIDAYGIGNVCVDKKNEHRGLGLILMSHCNDFIEQRNSLGVLLCKPELIAFYQKSGWEVIDFTEKYIKDKKYNSHVMLFGNKIEISKNQEIYFDREF